MTAPTYWELRELDLCGVETTTSPLGRCTLGFGHDGDHGDIRHRLAKWGPTVDRDALVRAFTNADVVSREGARWPNVDVQWAGATADEAKRMADVAIAVVIESDGGLK